VAFEVRAARDADLPEVAALVREMIPGGDADRRLAWLYERNPAGRALTWIAYERGEPAGCTSYFPFQLQLDGCRVLGALGGDGYVRPGFRRRGLGGLLHDAARAAMRANGIGCMYGAPGAMNLTPLKHGGSRQVGHVARWARPLRAAAFGAALAPLDRVVRELLRPRFAAELEPMVRDDARLDELWRRAAPTIQLGAVRDARFYTWRFLDAPAQRQPAFVIVRRGRPIGACALEEMNGGATLRIMDLFAIPGTWHAALDAIARYAADTDARTLDIKLMDIDGRRRMIWRAGFIERERKPFLVGIPADGDRRFLDPLRWFYGGADSDLDSLQ
jgi:GNAT superfamily N-acetyltransferase